MEKNVEGKGLARYLSRLDVWAMAFGCMVGWGAFVMPGTTFLPVAGPWGTLISMILGTLIMLMIGANFSFQMERNPGTGGVYSYTKNAFGRDHAFLCSWFLCLSYLTIVFLNATALFIVIRTIFGSLLQVGYHYIIAGNDIYLGEVAVSAIALAGIGFLFVKAKALLQQIFTVLSIVLFAGVLLTTVFCLPQAISSGAVHSFGTTGLDHGYAIFTIVILAPWAFVGFDVVSFDTAHFKFPMKQAKWTIAISIIIAGFVYAAMALVSVSAVPDNYASWQEYIADLGHLNGVASVPTFYAARTIIGPVGLAVMGVTALAAILTGMIGAYRATTRVLSTMAEDKILSDKFSKTTYSILFIMVISIVIAFLGRNALNWFVDLTSFGAVVGFAYTSASAWKLARKENNKTIMATSAAGTIITVAFAIVHLIPYLTALEAMGSASFLLLSLWCLLGFIFYWRTVNNSNLTEYSGMSTSGVVLFALLLYSVLMWFAKLLANEKSMDGVYYALSHYGVILLLIVFVGLVIMLYVQNLVRKKHEILEREKIRAVEGSLAKSQFLFNMSHDIRTPMNAIIGYTNLAMKEDQMPVVKDYLAKIDTSSQHLLNLINDVLEMSRIESGKIELEYEPADLCKIVKEIHDLFSQQMAQKRIDFTVNSNQVRNRYVWCDRKNLNRVLLNIISNAYKFTPEGGNITASIWEIGSGENGYGSYELRVQDNGIGMSKEFAEKMFNAFERERTSTVSKVEGTGLGLAITKSIIDLMDGTIEVITSPGSGTEMIIRLKFQLAQKEDVREEQVLANVASEPKQTLDFSKMRLLLVEDNDINREIAQMILAQAGFSIETAVNGQIAVDMVSISEPGYYDAVLMDIQMPVMDGYEATKAIRALENKELANIPIIAMTANAFKEDEQAAANVGMQAHIAKPLDVDKMLKTITAVLIAAKQSE
ncbi:MAG: amino acid permease [Clostridia bacterium]|nr:amino acid permease [Clostridia bacterium]